MGVDRFGNPHAPNLPYARGGILSSAEDHPWSEHFSCMIAGNREFVRNYPAATKRVLRAILKATDLCVSDPQGVARRLVDGGFVARYDDAFQALTEIPYDKWTTMPRTRYASMRCGCGKHH